MIDMQPLIDGCSQMRIELSEKQVSQFTKYLELLLEWNQKFNLTAITKPKEVIVQHFLDSISTLKLSQVEGQVRILDMGSGAGFPGIPLKIMRPQLQICLVDSVQKKVGFLNEMIEKLDLDYTAAIHARAEDLAKIEGHREAYDLVISRAVAELRVLAEYCLPFVRRGGYFISHKGPGAAEELDLAKSAINLLGGKWLETVEAKIPYSERTHNLIIIKKEKITPLKYPRSPGKPKKEPL
ncbi:MAG: 16S rRNA (guanine(527)-N(7))-methyltransferase RsmG [Clostridiales bacterium]|nr:16S rRNA (guanine(527)-N(7))-methyltransferase RsmG [Clostridiales bacterium]